MWLSVHLLEIDVDHMAYNNCIVMKFIIGFITATKANQPFML